MAFPKEFLDALARRHLLSAIVGRRVKLTRRGKEHTGLCPFHKEKTPSFTVSDDKGFFHCFGCGEHGDAIGFVMKTEGLSFPEAVEKLAAEASLEVPRDRPEDPERRERRKGLLEALEAAAVYFEEALWGSPGHAARDYLAERGLSEATIRSFRLGFAPAERGRLLAALRAKGFEPDLLAEAGLIKLPEADDETGGPGAGEIRDYFFNRIIFPIADRRGRVIAFGGRTMGESRAKYINSPDTPLFHKGRVLYNHASALSAARDKNEVIVAEGYMDVIALAQAGFPSAVAPLGTAVTEEQIQELWRLVPEPVFCLDGDKAGRRAAERAAERALPILKPGVSLQFAFLPEGEDPDSLLQREAAGFLRDLLDRAIPLVDLLWLKESQGRDLSTPERRAALRRDLRSLCTNLKDRELAADYLDDLMTRYDGAFPRRGQRDFNAGKGGGGGNWQGGNRPGSWRVPMGQGRGGRARLVDLGSAIGPPGYALKVAGAQDPENRMRRRREQLLLALLINHPPLIEERLEEISALAFSSPDLERLRNSLISAFLAVGEKEEKGDLDQSSTLLLDSEAMKCHLRDEGYSGLMDQLSSPEVLMHGRFAHPEATQAEAREGYSSVVRELQRPLLRSELDEAARHLAEEMSEDALKRLRARQQLDDD